MRLYQRSADRRPDPEPLPTDDRVPVLAGMVAWAVLLAAFLLTRGRLIGAGRGWWVWVPVAGLVLGVLGLRYVSRTRRR